MYSGDRKKDINVQRAKCHIWGATERDGNHSIDERKRERDKERNYLIMVQLNKKQRNMDFNHGWEPNSRCFFANNFFPKNTEMRASKLYGRARMKYSERRKERERERERGEIETFLIHQPVTPSIFPSPTPAPFLSQ